MSTHQALQGKDAVVLSLLLSTEDHDDYDKALEGVLAVFRPIDPVKERLVKHYYMTPG
jgi:hypothetical protein